MCCIFIPDIYQKYTFFRSRDIVYLIDTVIDLVFYRFHWDLNLECGKRHFDSHFYMCQVLENTDVIRLTKQTSFQQHVIFYGNTKFFW